jgi:hypothetical protein
MKRLSSRLVAVAAMKMHRFALRGLGFLVLWMLLHCGSELAAAVPPGQCCAHSLSLSQLRLLVATSFLLSYEYACDIV